MEKELWATNADSKKRLTPRTSKRSRRAWSYLYLYSHSYISCSRVLVYRLHEYLVLHHTAVHTASTLLGNRRWKMEDARNSVENNVNFNLNVNSQRRVPDSSTSSVLLIINRLGDFRDFITKVFPNFAFCDSPLERWIRSRTSRSINKTSLTLHCNRRLDGTL